MAEEQYLALKSVEESDLEQFIVGIHKDRWAQFRASHIALIYATVIAAISGVLAVFVPILGVLAIILFLCPLSLLFSAITRAISLNREGRFYRLTHKMAHETLTYEGFREMYARKVLTL